MVYRGFTIKPWNEIIHDVRPPRKGEGIQWVDKKPIKLFGGYKCPQIWGEQCMGGNRFKNPLTIEQSEIALKEIKESIDNLITKVIGWNNCTEKEAVKLIKES